jgi:ribosomal protein S25
MSEDLKKILKIDDPVLNVLMEEQKRKEKKKKEIEDHIKELEDNIKALTEKELDRAEFISASTNSCLWVVLQEIKNIGNKLDHMTTIVWKK